MELRFCNSAQELVGQNLSVTPGLWQWGLLQSSFPRIARENAKNIYIHSTNITSPRAPFPMTGLVSKFKHAIQTFNSTIQTFNSAIQIFTSLHKSRVIVLPIQKNPKHSLNLTLGLIELNCRIECLNY